MRNVGIFENNQSPFNGRPRLYANEGQPAADVMMGWFGAVPRQLVIGLMLVVALLAFEIFNFDTTQYALENLLGNVTFLGIGWAAILAIAFCAIDFAGLAQLFMPDKGLAERKEVWYLMGAWLLGATMNAIMTWWAVSLTLLNHQFGNEVLSRETLLNGVPVFVAVLVWLTRILFIGAFTVAGERLFAPARDEQRRPAADRQPQLAELMAQRPVVAKPEELPVLEPIAPARAQARPVTRAQRRPPLPTGSPGRIPVAMQAKGRNGR